MMQPKQDRERQVKAGKEKQFTSAKKSSPTSSHIIDAISDG